MVEVSLMPKKEEKKIPFEDIAVALVSGIFGLVMISSLGLFIYKNALNDNLEKLNASLQEIEASRDLETEAKFRTLKNKIENLKPIIAGHVYSSKLLTFLENKTHLQTQFSGLSVNVEANAISAQIKTPDFEIMSSQLAIWEGSSEIRSMGLSAMALQQDGGVGLSATIYFDPRIINFKK